MFGVGFTQQQCTCRGGLLGGTANPDANCDCFCFCDDFNKDFVPVFVDKNYAYEVDPEVIHPDDETCGCLHEDLINMSPSSSPMNDPGTISVGTSVPTISPAKPSSPSVFNDFFLPTNHVPIAEDDMYNTNENFSVTFDPVANDSDVDFDDLSIWAFIQPNNGMVTKEPNGLLTYVPNTNFIGTDIFQYVVTDGAGGFDTGTITIRVFEEPVILMILVSIVRMIMEEWKGKKN